MAKKPEEEHLDERSLQFLESARKTVAAVGKRGCGTCHKTPPFERGAIVRLKTIFQRGPLGNFFVDDILELVVIPEAHCTVCNRGSWEGKSLEDQVHAAVQQIEKIRRERNAGRGVGEQVMGFTQRPSGIVVPAI